VASIGWPLYSLRE